MTKSKFALAGALLAPAAVFAEGNASDLATACQSLETGVTGMISTVAPHLVNIVIALLAIVGIFFAWKYVRKAIGR